jgi:prevent-host-death family protein
MNTTITATELSKNLSDVLNRVRYRGERFTVARNGEPIAVLGPSDGPSRVTLRDLAAQIGDIPLPDAGFADDVDAMRRSIKNPRRALCRGRDGR